MPKVVSVPELILLKDPSYFGTHEAKDLGEGGAQARPGADARNVLFNWDEANGAHKTQRF